jgi:hypothetical protein
MLNDKNLPLSRGPANLTYLTQITGRLFLLIFFCNFKIFSLQRFKTYIGERLSQLLQLLATEYMVRVRYSVTARNLSALQNTLTASEIHKFSSPMGAGTFPLKIRRSECEAVLSQPFRADVKFGGVIPPLPHTSL